MEFLSIFPPFEEPRGGIIRELEVYRRYGKFGVNLKIVKPGFRLYEASDFDAIIVNEMTVWDGIKLALKGSKVVCKLMSVQSFPPKYMKLGYLVTVKSYEIYDNMLGIRNPIHFPVKRLLRNMVDLFLWRTLISRKIKLLYISETIPKLMSLSFNPEDIIYPAVAVDYNYPPKVPDVQDRDIDYLSICGALPEKGFLDVLYFRRKIDGRLVILGVPNKLVPLLRRKGIEAYPYLPRRRVFEFMKRSKVLLNPSWIDTLSMPILEALYFHVPLILTYPLPYLFWSKFNFPNLKVVSCLEEMVKKAESSNNNLCMPDYSDEQKEFLKLHSSWDNVAKEEVRKIVEWVEGRD